MEFHVWGKLDENGKIASVQSSCSHGNAFNFLPDQSPTSPPLSGGGGGGGGGGPWVGQSGEKYVPYSTKKELCYKLDSRLDEMSLMMVQMGEMTKRLQLQEKLIQEYETKSERQQTELHTLRQENKELRSLVSKRKRTSSGPFGDTDLSDPFFGSTEDTSTTTPKEIDSPMDCSDGSQRNSSTSSGVSNIDDVDGAKHANDVINSDSDDVKTSSERKKSPPVCDRFAKDKRQIDEMGTPLPCDENGYIQLGDEGESQNQLVQHVHFTLDSSGYVQIPDMTSDGQSNLSNQSDTGAGAVDDGTGSDQTWHTGQSAESEATSREQGKPKADSGAALSSDVKVPNVETAAAMEDDIPRPEVHSPSRYEVIPDGLVSQRSPPTKGQAQGQTQGQGQCPNLYGDRYSERAPMPLPGRRSCGNNLGKAASTESDTPYRNKLSKELKNCTNGEKRDSGTMNREHKLIHSKELKNCTNGEKRDSVTMNREHKLLHRHSSPDLPGALAMDKRLSALLVNMKTTMEWNQARRRLMTKSTDYTVEQAADTLRAIVKETYYRCNTQADGKGKPGPTVESIAQKLRNTMLRQRSFDEDILTPEFLQKCIHLLRAT